MEILLGIVAAVAAALALEALGVPAGALVGSMLAIAALKMVDVEVPDLARWLRFAVYVGVGWLLGQGFTPEVPRLLARAAPATLLVVGVLLVVGGGLAFVLYRFGAMDAPTALLAASPGGISQMAVFTAESGANPAIVITVHLMRVLSLVLLLPLAVRWLPAP